MILDAKFGQHVPLNRQSETYAREDIHLDVSTLGGWVGACTAALAPLVALIRAHVLAGARIHGDDTTVPVRAEGCAGAQPAIRTVGRASMPDDAERDLLRGGVNSAAVLEQLGRRGHLWEVAWNPAFPTRMTAR